MSTYEPIAVTICEDGETHTAPVIPEGSGSLELFPFHDPFGVRKAVVPVLLNDVDGITQGSGSAFHIDGWGTFLTADHVVESVRRRSKRTRGTGGEIRFDVTDLDVCPTLLLGLGLVFGRPAVPPQALARVASIRSPVRERENPLATLAGQTELESASDIAVMQLGRSAPEKMIGTLRVRFAGVLPSVGQTVVAVGFPDLGCQPVDDMAMRYLLSDGMSAAYGRITGLHPNGVRNDSTPVIEVEATWPSGMSGGPVFNDKGEVIAVVSRSWLPSHGKAGVGYAACLPMMPWLRSWLPTVDISNPCWRVGWAVTKNRAELIAFYRDQNDAAAHQSLLGSSFGLAFGSNRIGSTDFFPR